MSTFTHTIEVVATMDDGSTIRIGNAYGITGVLHASQYEVGGNGGTFPEPMGETPDFMLVMNRGRNAQLDLGTTAENFATDMDMGDCFILHGPQVAETGNSSATANTGVFDSMNFRSPAPRATVIVLNKTAS